VAELADYLDLTVSQARRQFRELKLRSPVSSGRQAVFLPVETLLCLAVSFQINHRRYGGSTAHLAPEPIPSLARLFSRPPSSVLAKMANLDGSRSHGGKYDILAGAVLRDEPAHFTHIYRTLLTAARAEGMDQHRLPDFLGLEHDGEFDLLGLFQGVGLPFRSHQDVAPMPNMVWLYRRPILDYWAEHDETLGHIVRHVLIHEIGHHFGLSDEDMEAIEQKDAARDGSENKAD